MHVKLSPTTTNAYRTSPHLHCTRQAVAARQVAEAKTAPGAGGGDGGEGGNGEGGGEGGGGGDGGGGHGGHEGGIVKLRQ